ncbi:hypothetical protein BegalDRAFT_0943 [Beggiatoa alba B18LD]|uniref:Uncharacterized protein n=1 Tax=Beggiatoa alba B18LD TaxID=395493 RepID=I3CE07_9GAMM|nr:hypothetical protein BegalDRAFT_0943 [Beggiatoa alba B18LD]
MQDDDLDVLIHNVKVIYVPDFKTTVYASFLGFLIGLLVGFIGWG